jgi:hypothetical protein
MKRNSKLILAGLLAGGFMVDPASAQTAAPAPRTNAPMVRPMMRDRTDFLAQSLKLTDEQKEKIRPIIKEEADQFAALRTQTNMPPQDRGAKIKEIREATAAKLKPILTEEQWQRYSRPFTNRLQTVIRTNVPPATPAPAPAK